MRQVSYTRRTAQVRGHLRDVLARGPNGIRPGEAGHVEAKAEKDRGRYLRQHARGGRIAEMKLHSGDGARPRVRAHNQAAAPRIRGDGAGPGAGPLPRTEHGD
jgi:hypothetical protein